MGSIVRQSEKIPVFLKQKQGLLLIILLSLTLIQTFLSHKLLLTPNVYYNSFQEQLSIEQINKLIQIGNKYEYLGYLFIILIATIKCFLIALIIQGALILWGFKTQFSPIIKVVLFAEFVFLIPLIIKLIWFYFFKSVYSIEDIQLFSPLSLFGILSNKNIAPIWIYPLQLLNIFELGYWFILAWGLSKILSTDFDKSLQVILSSYVPALFIWVIFVMFLTVTLNPS
ncbi:MAG: hypothetical protein ACKOWO_02110 [Sediminibacterium sp.]